MEEKKDTPPVEYMYPSAIAGGIKVEVLRDRGRVGQPMDFTITNMWPSLNILFRRYEAMGVDILDIMASVSVAVLDEMYHFHQISQRKMYPIGDFPQDSYCLDHYTINDCLKKKLSEPERFYIIQGSANKAWVVVSSERTIIYTLSNELNKGIVFRWGMVSDLWDGGKDIKISGINPRILQKNDIAIYRKGILTRVYEITK